VTPPGSSAAARAASAAERGFSSAHWAVIPAAPVLFTLSCVSVRMQLCSFPAHTLIVDVRNLILSCSSNS
jgi:hypothetical protein